MSFWQAPFALPEPERVILTTTDPTEIVAAADNKQAIAKIHVCNVTGAEATLDLEVFDGTDSYYLFKGHAIAANGTLTVTDEILQVNHSMRATASVADALHVSVIRSLPQR